MRALDRKLIRDLWHIRGQSLAISLVMACGVATFVMSLSMIQTLRFAHDSFYERCRFAEVFAQVKRAPLSLQERIARVDGVAQVSTRIVHDVSLDIPGLDEPAIGRLISLAEEGGETLNRLHLRRGRTPRSDHPQEVLAIEAFVDAHRMRLGDSLTAVINGRRQDLRIVGVVLSPEYVYQIRPGEILPDDKRFGVFWMNRRALAAAFDMEGAFNDLALSLQPGASLPEVIRRLDLLIEPFGGLGAFGRDDHPSHRFVSNEIRELRGMATTAPTIFLSVAAFLFNLVLARLVSTQREQIGALKAFGYSRLDITGHYLMLAVLIVLVAVVIGCVVGAWLGRDLAHQYTQFFHFPEFTFHLEFWIVILAAAVAVLAGLAGILGAVRRAAALPAARAMQPEPPPVFAPSIVERLGFQRMFSPAARMVIRHLQRTPVRSAFSVSGIALATAVLVLGSFMEDAVFHMMDVEFRRAQRQEVAVQLDEVGAPRVVHELAHLPGVRAVEPYRAVPARIRSGHHERRISIMGLPGDRRLFQVVDLYGRFQPIPECGLVLSSKLAELLEARPGDIVQVEVLSESRPVEDMVVSATVDDFAGLSAYMNLASVRTLMGEDSTVSGAHLAVDTHRLSNLYACLKGLPAVAGVTIRAAALESFQSTIAENILRMRLFNIGFATIIAFGVVYNCVRIALSERARDLATLRVMGFTRAEVSYILLGEVAVLAIAAILPGLALGYGFAAWATSTYDTELFRIPLVVAPSTFAMATVVIIAAALASGIIARRRINSLDLLSVLKSRD